MGTDQEVSTDQGTGIDLSPTYVYNTLVVPCGGSIRLL